jgi:peptide methionine sulfoxide reductase MsrA
VTAVGYAGGFTPNPTYEEVCTGLNGHNEAVLVVFDPSEVIYEALLIFQYAMTAFCRWRHRRALDAG